MKINSLQLALPQKYNTNYKGYVNGNLYSEYVIENAKKALKNKNWENEIRAGKNSFFKDYFGMAKDDIPLRIIAALVSFGGTEMAIAGICALNAMSDKTEENINNIKNCMIDLLKSRQNKL